MARVYDRILQRESRLNLTGLDDVDLLLIPMSEAKALAREYKDEHEIDEDVDINDLSDYLGIKVVLISDARLNSFKFFREIG